MGRLRVRGRRFCSPRYGEELARARAGSTAQLTRTTAAGAVPGLRFRGVALGLGNLPSAESKLPFGSIYTQHLDLDAVANLDDIFRAFHLMVGQLGDMQQPFQARLQLDEDAEVGKLRHLTGYHPARLIPARDVGLPRVAGKLLQAQGDAIALAVHIKDNALDLVALLDDFVRVVDFADPAHVADVQETVDPLFHLHEGAVIGQV